MPHVGQPYDLPAGSAAVSALTVDVAVRQRALMHAGKTAIEMAGQRLSFGVLMQRADRLAHVLHGRGVRRGDRIAVLAENRMEYLETLLAAGLLGAIAACCNWRQSDLELDHGLRLTTPTLLLVSERYAPRLAQLAASPDQVLIYGANYEALLAAAPAAPYPSVSQAEDGLLIMFTSGTTGYPKGAVLSHRCQVARALIGVVDGQLYPGRGGIVWSPLYHIAGADHALGLLMQGDTVFLVDGFQPEELVAIMAREELGTVSLMPAAVGRVIDEIKRTGQRPKSVMACGSMADLVPRHQIAEASALLNAGFRNSFGATETGQPPASRNRIAPGVVPTSLSKTQSSYCALRLVDENDCDVPDGTPGEILIRGPSLFSGYWGDAAATAEAFRGGWYHMGDLMVRNPDGTLDFVDRRKYLIKSGGENIYPAEIERVLLADGRFKDAAVVRKMDAHWGEVPVVFVVAAEGAVVNEGDVLALCSAQLARYKIPKAVYFIADHEMPRNDTSKVKRHELEQRLSTMPASTPAV